MFLSWKGFEIDGSDTDFDIVLPEIKERDDFIQCFLETPIFQSGSSQIYYNSQAPKFEQVKLSLLEAATLLKNPDHPEIFIDVNCITTDEMAEPLREQIYALSAMRDPHEEAYGKVKNPCMAPCKQKDYKRGNMTGTLGILKQGTKAKWFAQPDDQPEGYLRNEDLLLSKDDLPCFTINVGPSFYYEYAMFIMQWLTDHFPSIAVAGGLDCGGGWTDGCTYASSIYDFEKIQLPVRHSVNNTVKRLSEYGLMQPYQRYYKKGWQYELLPDFRMVNIPPQVTTHTYDLPYPKYISHVEQALAQQRSYYDTICDTATQIVLPMPDRFASVPHIQQQLLATLADLGDPSRAWNYEAYVAFAVVSGQPICEYRIFWKMRAYFLQLLAFIESGDLDYLKAENYEQRKQRHDKH